MFPWVQPVSQDSVFDRSGRDVSAGIGPQLIRTRLRGTDAVTVIICVDWLAANESVSGGQQRVSDRLVRPPARG